MSFNVLNQESKMLKMKLKEQERLRQREEYIAQKGQECLQANAKWGDISEHSDDDEWDNLNRPVSDVSSDDDEDEHVNSPASQRIELEEPVKPAVEALAGPVGKGKKKKGKPAPAADEDDLDGLLAEFGVSTTVVGAEDKKKNKKKAPTPADKEPVEGKENVEKNVTPKKEKVVKEKVEKVEKVEEPVPLDEEAKKAAMETLKAKLKGKKKAAKPAAAEAKEIAAAEARLRATKTQLTKKEKSQTYDR